MRILIACEFSGLVRDAFIAKGHDAMSCDLLPTERPGPHWQGNALYLLASKPAWYWDMIIAFPPCTRICNSGVRWLHERDLWKEMREAADFFRLLLNAKAKKKAVENPIPHKYALEIIGRKYDQIIQPWQFGHGETKATCLWLEGLPPLQPTNIVSGREGRVWKMPPGPDRAKERSRTYQGVADAMANQWK